ncbi:hypothetical protein HU200_006123 [Digitaria exilis]|uniref:CUE domain-containing protein n=1 Tax=Digitaria exilis TaxID=1010633 RepID=A0A835KQX9_9POAL|nr:hypothetical protein HU200_006123 [Digitaria exilis]
MEGCFQLNPNASPFIPGSLSSFAVSDKAPENQADFLAFFSESSSKGGTSGDTFDPSEYEENDMDPVALATMLFSMFPNVSTDFIDELFKANDFDINLTVDMLHELSSQDMLHDDADDINDLHDGQGLPGDSYRHAEVSESNSNLNEDLQNEKSATTSDVESVLPKFSNISLVDNDLVCAVFSWCLYFTYIVEDKWWQVVTPYLLNNLFLICLFIAGPA